MNITLPEKENRSLQAYAGFNALGPAATSAIPALAKLLNNPEHTFEAATCLSKIGPPAFPVLICGLTNSDTDVERSAFWTLLDLTPEGRGKDWRPRLS